MNYSEAAEKAARLNKLGDPGAPKNPEFIAWIERVLPEHIDPPNVDDNGWDVVVRVNTCK